MSLQNPTREKPNKELQAVWVCIAQGNIFMGHAITFYGVLSLRSSGAAHYTDARYRQEIRKLGDGLEFYCPYFS